MKTTITLLLFALFTITVQGQNQFAKKYLELRQPTGDKFVAKTFKGNEIKQFTDSLASIREYNYNKELFEMVNQITVIMDMNQEGRPSSSQIDKLLKPYDELTSIEQHQMKTKIMGIEKRGKIKELLITNEYMGDGFMSKLFGNALTFINISFKKPILLSDYMEDTKYFTQLIGYNSTSEGENQPLIDISFQTEGKWELQPQPWREWESVKENDLYGVKAKDHNFFTIKPKYKEEIIIYRSNSFNSEVFLLAKSNDKPSYILYDQFGFVIAEADEVKPIYIPETETIAYFIIRKDDNYSLYECPEHYRQQQNGNTITAHINYRIENCQSIQLKDNNTLECVKSDGAKEVIDLKEN